MKYCDTCHTTYPNEFSACPKDQAPLRETAEMVEGMVIREKYQIVRKIGEGRMATVYQAKHLTFNETRALKVLQNRLAQDEAFVNRFKSEAVTRKLQHENVVRVEDFDFAEDDSPFLVMEYVDGKSLRNVMVDGPMAPARAAGIARQIALALSAAHKLGITHRDIKPENVLLVQQPDGRELVKVLEFGLARVREQSTDLLPQYATTTKTAVVVGTPQYISPEQAMGKKGDDIDARADIYSLGITLYEMLTAKLPFQSATPVGMLVQHITATPKSPAELLAQPPNPLSEIVMKAIQKSRDNRYQTADEMAAELAKAQPVDTPRPAAAIPTPPPRTTGTFTPKPGTVMIKFETPKASKAAPVESRPAASAASAAVKTPPPMSMPKLRTGSSAAAAAPAVASIAEPIFDRSHPAPQVKAPTFDAMSIDEKPGSKTPLIAIGAVLGILILGALIFWPKKSAAPKAEAVEQTATKGDDGKLLLDVQQLLATSPTFNDVNATVDKGVVTLSGLVASKGDSERADGIVKNSIGVKDVKNEIVVNAKAIARLEAPINAPKPAPAKPAPAKPAKGKTVAAPPAPAPVAAPVNPGQLRARAMIALGNRQVDSGDYSGAVNAFQSALILDPGNAAAEAGLRRANEAMKNH